MSELVVTDFMIANGEKSVVAQNLGKIRTIAKVFYY